MRDASKGLSTRTCPHLTPRRVFVVHSLTSADTQLGSSRHHDDDHLCADATERNVLRNETEIFQRWKTLAHDGKLGRRGGWWRSTPSSLRSHCALVWRGYLPYT